MSEDSLEVKLEYKVLCIDDDDDWLDSIKGNVPQFKHITIDWKKDTDFDSRSSSNIHTYDLILVDYNLNNDHKGDDHIRCFRDEKGCLTNIIFYSSQDISGCDVSSWDGVISCTRDEVAEELKKTIESFGYRLSDHNIMRGLILAEAIDVENQLGNIILMLFGGKAKLFKEKVFEKGWMTFANKLNFVQSYIKDLKSNEQLSELQKVLGNLQQEVIDPRNILAHGSSSLSDKGSERIFEGLKKQKPILFDNKWKNTIRQNIRKHKDNLNKLYNYIKENQQV